MWEKSTPIQSPSTNTIVSGNSAMSANYIGRWFYQNIGGGNSMTALALGSEIRFTVQGTTQVTGIFYVDPSLTLAQQPYIAVSVDGGAWSRVQVTTGSTGYLSVAVASNLTTASHNIRIVFGGIDITAGIWANARGLTILGYSLDTGGTMIPWILPKKRILFMGDSITAGVHATTTGGISDMCRGELAYPSICASALNDSYQLKWAFGFTGAIHVGDGGVPNAVDNFGYYAVNRPIYDWGRVDVICINHGTNDSGYIDTDVQTAYTNLVNKVKQTYPGIPIFCLRPFNGAKSSVIQSVASSLGCTYLDTTGWVTSFTDGLHPDIAGHQSAGTQLSTALKQVLGDTFF